METTGNKFALLLIVCFSSHLLHLTQAASATPRRFPTPVPSILRSSSPPPPAPASNTPARKLVSTLPVNIPILPAPEDPLVRELCDSTDNPFLCLSTINPFLQGNFDQVSILEGAIQACVNYTTLLVAEAKRIAADPSTAPDISSNLENCLNDYDDALYDLNEAAKAVAARDVELLDSNLSAVLSYVGTCHEDTMSPSPVAHMEDTLNALANNCLVIIGNLEW